MFGHCFQRGRGLFGAQARAHLCRDRSPAASLAPDPTAASGASSQPPACAVWPPGLATAVAKGQVRSRGLTDTFNRRIGLMCGSSQVLPAGGLVPCF